MKTQKLERVRGLFSMIHDIVDKGSSTVQEVHVATANRTFDILQEVRPIAVPVSGVRAIHDASLAATYDIVRLVNHAVSQTASLVIDAVEQQRAAEE